MRSRPQTASDGPTGSSRGVLHPDLPAQGLRAALCASKKENMKTQETSWLGELYELVARFPQYGAECDLEGMSEAERWGLYRFLQRVSKEA